MISVSLFSLGIGFGFSGKPHQALDSWTELALSQLCVVGIVPLYEFAFDFPVFVQTDLAIAKQMEEVPVAYDLSSPHPSFCHWGFIT